MTLLPVDPGLSNGIAILDDDHHLLLASEIPTAGEGANKRLDLSGFARLLADHHVDGAVVEDVSAMPKQGVSSTFRFGRAAGAVDGALAALKIATFFVKPATWKKDIGAKAKSAEDIRALAIQTWPDQAHRFSRKLDHNRAEAALIGLWFIRRFGKRSD